MTQLKKYIKNSIIYRWFYQPLSSRKRQVFLSKRRSLFKKEGYALLQAFVECMDQERIPYWLEYGTLLGAYRDGSFIPNELDIDVGINLSDARRVYFSLVNNGFKLIREFHVVGENGLEQTYEYHGITIDIMYFYRDGDSLWCNGIYGFPKANGVLFKAQITAHKFIPFGLTKMSFMGLTVTIPDNVEKHLSEIYGESFRVYDPNFPGDFNKYYYQLSEKWGMGFVVE